MDGAVAVEPKGAINRKVLEKHLLVLVRERNGETKTTPSGRQAGWEGSLSHFVTT